MAHENLLSFFSDQVNLYLDNRLSPESTQHLMDIVQKDDECSQVFKKEKTFRDFVKNNVKRPCASSDLIQSIKSNLG
jgi:hypothetical protein